MVYQLTIETAAVPGEPTPPSRKVRGEADNALVAAKEAEHLLGAGERVVSVKPLWDLDW